MPIVSSKMSRVRFERFEYEDDPSLSPSQRTLVKRAEPRNWVGPNLAGILRRSFYNTDWTIDGLPAPARVKPIDIKAHNNWWGAYHLAHEKFSTSLGIQSPTTGHDITVRSRILHHESCWDEQALTSNSTEIILEKFTKRGTKELAALLIRSSSNSTEQELVLAADNSWHAPSDIEETIAKDMVFTMSRLALQQNNPYAVDNTGHNL